MFSISESQERAEAEGREEGALALVLVNWFKAMGQWQQKGYVPKEGDIIFFDWEVDVQVNHVGIVEKAIL